MKKHTDSFRRDRIDSHIKRGYVPIASAEELNSIRDYDWKVFGKGTEWEGIYPCGVMSEEDLDSLRDSALALLDEDTEWDDDIISGSDRRYIQVRDIDMSEIKDFKPIGAINNREEKPFTGRYIGGDFVVRNLKIDNEHDDNIGLFGFTKDAIIRNVVIEDAIISGRDSVGGIIGFADSTTTSNCSFKGKIKGTNINIGGIVGESYNSEIRYCSTSAKIIGNKYVGGIIGGLHRSDITNCVSQGTIFAKEMIAGGLVGLSEISSIRNSKAHAHVKSQASVGGICGYITNTVIKNCQCDNKLFGSFNIKELAIVGEDIDIENLGKSEITKSAFTGEVIVNK